MLRLINADILTTILEGWEEKACDGTENDGSDGTTRVLHPVPTTTREMIDLIADQPTIEDKTEDFMLAMADMNAKFAEEKLAFLKLIKELAEAPQWIPVTERLPEPFVSVLVQMPGEKPFPTVREGFLSSNGIWHSALYDREPDEVTHWMPMPQPPEDGGADYETE